MDGAVAADREGLHTPQFDCDRAVTRRQCQCRAQSARNSLETRARATRRFFVGIPPSTDLPMTWLEQLRP